MRTRRREDVGAGPASAVERLGFMSLPAELLASVATPTLVICGEQSVPMLRAAARAAAETLPNGRLASLPGQSHDISPEATAPVIADFLTG
jgi:pimeloyl-ACP methyl ester carboxylesterase